MPNILDTKLSVWSSSALVGSEDLPVTASVIQEDLGGSSWIQMIQR